MSNKLNIYVVVLGLMVFVSNSYAEGQPVGKKLFDFTVPITSVSYHADRTEINLQTSSPVADLGTVGATITLYSPVNATVIAGLYSSEGAAFRPDDKVITFSGRGSWKAIGNHRWQLDGISLNAEGTRSYFSSVLSLDGMSVSGSAYSLD